MRLLNVDTFAFTTFPTAHVPVYAIASHRWIEGTEASYEDVQRGTGKARAGFVKIEKFVDYIKTHVPLIKWLWIDTCCIDKRSSQEVGEAINSMFQWYRGAEVCLAWLEDVSTPEDTGSFQRSVWFRRGWTLQELLAPAVVVFFSRDWRVIGHKGHGGHRRSGIPMQMGASLECLIAGITNIPEGVLGDYESARNLSVRDKLKWMANRETTRDEDLSYCLLGIIRYGDGKDETRLRLMEKVRKKEDRPATTASEKYSVPFSLKGIPVADHFVPRETDMQHLTAFFNTSSPLIASASSTRQRVFVVHGMEGMGKTQLCVEFARTHRDHFSAIFWLEGASRDSLRQSMADTALRLPIEHSTRSGESSGASTDISQLIQSFQCWLSLSDNRNWLLIIDNADREWKTDPPDPQAYDYREFLPSADHGNIIITTRLQRLRRPNASLGLGRVEDELAGELIQSRADRRIEDIDVLLPMLYGLPSALVQAGSYLSATGMTVAEYVRCYNHTLTELMESQEQLLPRDDAERTMLTTWKISYDQVKRVNEQAAMLLDLSAFLNPGDIWPELILKGCDGAPAPGCPGESSIPVRDMLPSATRLSLQHSIGVLTQYSMISIGSEDDSHSIHPVLHAWCLHNLTSAGPRHRLLVTALAMVVPKRGAVKNNWTGGIPFRLAAHAKALRKSIGMLEEGEEAADECYEVGFFSNYWDSSYVVKQLYLQAMRRYSKILKRINHVPLTQLKPEEANILGKFLQVFTIIGQLHTTRGQAEKIEEATLDVVRKREEKYGPKGLLTLKLVGSLGSQYAETGQMRKADEMFIRALQGYEKGLGAFNKSTLGVVKNLGAVYMTQGKLENAEANFLRAFRGYEQILDIETSAEQSNVASYLGKLYRMQRKNEQAESMFVRALRGYEATWGASHGLTLSIVVLLGDLYMRQGKLEEAENMFLRALRGYKSTWGAAHGSTLTTAVTLGVLYITKQGKLEEGEKMVLRALRGYETTLGAAHRSTTATVTILAFLYMGQGKLEEAEMMCSRALKGYRNLPDAPKHVIDEIEKTIADVQRRKSTSDSLPP